MNLNLIWWRRWRPRDASSRRWRLHEHMRVYVSRERAAAASRRYQSTQVDHMGIYLLIAGSYTALISVGCRGHVPIAIIVALEWLLAGGGC